VKGEAMLAVEFKSTIDNGMIEIPKEYVNQLGKEVRVILLKESIEFRSLNPDFSAISLNTKGFNFSREEANER
jgi:hypothetical protein